MKDVYLVSYSVNGIKTIDQPVSLSFYKKTISQQMDTREYNIKGIYGINGSGKSGIITSVGILKNLLINAGYLNNPMAQKNLDAMINKKTGELWIAAEFIFEIGKELLLFRYEVTVSKGVAGKYVISQEQLFSKKATSKNGLFDKVFSVVNGEIVEASEKGGAEFTSLVKQKTTNLLESATLCALFYEKMLVSAAGRENKNFLFLGLTALLILGKKLYVYLDQSDDHVSYFIRKSFDYDFSPDNMDSGSETDHLIAGYFEMNGDQPNALSVTSNVVPKALYSSYEKTVEKLSDFLRIFKTDLRGIEIDKKEDRDDYVCSLVMVYDFYKIHVEFESTGIKKLVKLYAYLQEMVHGSIVFIDEFDSNLHDVYLCALLEYLMEYGTGQLCFTTHNVGPMDILRQNKKSIDFLSLDHKIYPWTTNGNYSPARLYRNGMIEGSPFNVDSIDFIGVFDLDGEGD